MNVIRSIGLNRKILTVLAIAVEEIESAVPKTLSLSTLLKYWPVPTQAILDILNIWCPVKDSHTLDHSTPATPAIKAGLGSVTAVATAITSRASGWSPPM